MSVVDLNGEVNNFFILEIKACKDIAQVG